MKASNSRLRIIAALFLLCLTTVSAPAKETWTRVQSKNFTLVGNGSAGEIRKVAIKLEQFRDALARLFPKTRLNTSVPTTVVVFKTDESFNDFKPRYKGKVKERIGGYFIQGEDGNYVAMTTDTGRLRTPYQVIFHEYVHFLVGNNLKDAPLWLNEGLAEFYSTFETSDDEQDVIIGRAIIWHLATLNQGRMLPLKTLLAVDHKSPHYNESSKAGIFYAESWALVHYLMLGNNQKRQAQLSRFITQLGTMPLEENFRSSFGATYEEIERELFNYVNRVTYPAIKYTFTKQLEFDKEMQTAVLSEAEVKYYQANLLLRLHEFDEAEGYLQKSIELDPKLAAPQVSMGILRFQQGRRSEAVPFFERALKEDPQNYLAHIYYALALSAEGKTEKAIKSYKEAIRLKPDSLKAYTQLAALYSSLWREEEALAAYNQASRVDLYESSVYRSRAYILLRLGRGQLAAVNARSYVNLEGWHDISAPYMSLAAYFGYRQAKQDADAAKMLDDALAKYDAEDWPYAVFKYLHRDITAQQLMELANDKGKLTEAHTYIGLDMSLAGRRDEALEHLRWVKENGLRNYVEYPLAVRELVRLGDAAIDKPAPADDSPDH